MLCISPPVPSENAGANMDQLMCSSPPPQTLTHLGNVLLWSFVDLEPSGYTEIAVLVARSQRTHRNTSNLINGGQDTPPGSAVDV